MGAFKFLFLTLLGMVLFSGHGMALALSDNDPVAVRDGQGHQLDITGLLVYTHTTNLRTEEKMEKKTSSSTSFPFAESVVTMTETFTLHGGTLTIPAETVGSTTLAAETIIRSAQTTAVRPGPSNSWTRNIKPIESISGAGHPTLSSDPHDGEVKSPALGPRHPYALLCNNVDLTRLCQLPPFQYYCTANGQVARQGVGYAECTGHCGCRLIVAGNPYQNVLPDYCGVFNWKNIECGLWTKSIGFEKQDHGEEIKIEIAGTDTATLSRLKRTEQYSSAGNPDFPGGHHHPKSTVATLSTVTTCSESSLRITTCTSPDVRTCPTSITLSGISMPLPDGIGPFCTMLRADRGAGAGAGVPFGTDVAAVLNEFCS